MGGHCAIHPYNTAKHKKSFEKLFDKYENNHKYVLLYLILIRLENSCNRNWQKYDEEIMLEKIKDVGCQPFHWMKITNAPLCQNQKQMKRFTQFNITEHKVACQSIQKILYNYEEFEILEDWTDGWINEISKMFEVLIEFQDDIYMEVRQMRDYGIQSVVGEIGGYMGLFLGFAILQIPELIFNIYCYTKNGIGRWKTKNNHI